jgi:hypothetical protein
VTARDVQSYLTTHLTLSGCHSGGGSDVVEAANDTENAGGQRDVNGDLDANSCMSWSEIRTNRRDVYTYRNHTTLVPNS